MRKLVTLVTGVAASVCFSQYQLKAGDGQNDGTPAHAHVFGSALESHSGGWRDPVSRYT